jgi:hypothetical protein
MGELDLDAARAARAEARGEPPTVTLGGETFTLPVEIPMRYIWALVEGDDMDALKVLFNGQLDRFLATEPSGQDIVALVAGVPKLYGMASQGESPASAGSSSNGSSRSRPTSPATTKSTSAKRSTARRRSG